MFKIVDFRNMDGKIRMLIETDDFTTVLMLRLFSQADKFANLYHYRMTSASKFDVRQKLGPAHLGKVKAFRADQLRQFRSLQGTRIEQLRILKEMRVLSGQNITLDRIVSEISLALEDEQNIRLENVRHLSEKGVSPTEIAKRMGIPRSTVYREIKKLREPPKKDDSEPSRVFPFSKRPSRASKK